MLHSTTRRALAAATLSLCARAVVQCPDISRDGCRAPSWPPQWAMARSTYVYCYHACPLGWLANHTELGLWGGLVGVDHYYTHQGMPCVGGVPQEFAAQDAFAAATKRAFPGARVLQYRITSGVPYDAVVHDAMLAHPEWFVHWRNGSMCLMRPEAQTGRPGDNCSWPIQAAAYNWGDAAHNASLQAWFVERVVAPTRVHGDGAWIDGDGPDNGAWACSGQYDHDKLPPPYPALAPDEIAAYCAGEAAAAAAAHAYLADRGGFDYNCARFVSSNASLPAAGDGAPACAAKLLALQAAPPAPATVLYGSRTAGAGYTDATAAGAVAAFLLVRGPHYFFGAPAANALAPATAALLLSDFGPPRGNMTRAGDVFSRDFDGATVSLDCATFTAAVAPRAAAGGAPRRGAPAAAG